MIKNHKAETLYNLRLDKPPNQRWKCLTLKSIKNGNNISHFYFVCSTIWSSLHNFENVSHLFLKKF